MTGLQIALAVILLILSLGIVVVVLLQKDRQADASAMTGGGLESSFFDKTKGRRRDDTFAFITKVLGFAFAIVSIATTGIILFVH